MGYKEAVDVDEVAEEDEPQEEESLRAITTAEVAAVTTVAAVVAATSADDEAEDADDDEHLANMCLVAMASKPVIAELEKNATQSHLQKSELSQAIQEQNTSLENLLTLLGGGSAAAAVQERWKEIAEEVDNASDDEGDDDSIDSVGQLATICLVAMATKPVIAELEKNANASTIQKAELTQAMKQQVTSLNKVLMLLQVQAQTQVVGAEPADIKAVRQEPIKATADDVVFEDVSETSSSSKEEATTAVVSKGKKEDKTNDTHLSQAVADYESIVTPSSSRGDVPVVEKASSDLTEDTDPLKEEEAVTPARVAVAATRSIPVAEATPVVATRSVVVPPSPPSPPSSVVVPVPSTKKKKLPSWNAGGAVAGAGAAAAA